MRHLTANELQFIYPEYRCLFCGCGGLIGGPRGGFMRNMTCASCGAQFNLVAPDCRYIVRDGERIIAVPPIGQLLEEPRAARAPET